MYYNEQTSWQQVQTFLPAAYQLTGTNLPDEYFINYDGMSLHIDHYRPNEPIGTILMLHGVGGNGRLLSCFALPLAAAGYEVICPDLPMYGNTVVTKDTLVTYTTWLECCCYLVRHFQALGHSITLFGLSAGGFLAYQTACCSKDIRALLATCLLDQRCSEVTRQTAAFPLLGTLGKLLLPGLQRLLPSFKLPMKLVGNMKAIVNNKQLAAILMQDQRASGSNVTLSFLNGLLHPEVTIEPEQFHQCPVLLVHPAEDHWTDVSLSKLFFERLTGEKQLVMMEGAGHFPIEKTGLEQITAAATAFLTFYK